MLGMKSMLASPPSAAIAIPKSPPPPPTPPPLLEPERLPVPFLDRDPTLNRLFCC